MLAKLFSLVLIAFSFNYSSHAKTLNQKEIRVGIIYHIAKYISWPQSSLPASNTFIYFCFLESSPDRHSNLLVDRTFQVAGKQLQVVELSTLDEANSRQCHVLFVNDKISGEEAEKTLAQLNKEAITIGTNKAFLDIGGMSAVVLQQGKMRILMNRTATQRTKLKISPKLLKRVNFSS